GNRPAGIPTTTGEKVTPFRSLFRSREEVFPSRFESKRTKYCQELCLRFLDQAATFFTPSSNTTPRITSARRSVPFSALQRFWADMASLKTIVRHAIRLPHPFVLFVRRRTVENVDSMGFDVRRWIQCSAGKS